MYNDKTGGTRAGKGPARRAGYPGCRLRYGKGTVCPALLGGGRHSAGVCSHAGRAGHSGHFLENGWSLLRSWFRETSLTPPWTADDAALQEKAAELAEQLDIDPAKITMESDIMSDFEADSLDIVDMVMTLEDEFGIEVPDDAIENLRTVGDVVEFVDSHKG